MIIDEIMVKKDISSTLVSGGSALQVLAMKSSHRPPDTVDLINSVEAVCCDKFT